MAEKNDVYDLAYLYNEICLLSDTTYKYYDMALNLIDNVYDKQFVDTLKKIDKNSNIILYSIKPRYDCTNQLADILKIINQVDDKVDSNKIIQLIDTKYKIPEPSSFITYKSEEENIKTIISSLQPDDDKLYCLHNIAEYDVFRLFNKEYLYHFCVFNKSELYNDSNKKI